MTQIKIVGIADNTYLATVSLSGAFCREAAKFKRIRDSRRGGWRFVRQTALPVREAETRL